MANFTNNGTYALPFNGDYNATVDPNLTAVTFDLSATNAAAYDISSNSGSISSNSGSGVTVNAPSNVTTFLTSATNGGTVTLGSGLVGQVLSINAIIDGGGSWVTPGNLLNQLNGGSLTFGSGGGVDLLGTAGTKYNLAAGQTAYGFTSSADVIDDQSLAFGQFSFYDIGASNNGSQQIIVNSGSDSALSFTVFGANLPQGQYTSTSTGPLLLTNDGTGGTDITPNVVCYVRGTRIATPQGESAVEALRVGDLVDTGSGLDGERTAQPVKWLGCRHIDLTAHPHPDTVAPIRICRSALADNVPHRDLLLSPDHAILVDGKLISARQLVNGVTIRQERNWRSVEYFHVELEGHAILLAEGLPAESYLNTGNRGFFANANDPLVLHPDLTNEASYPAREVASCAPFVWDEANVRPVWQALADRSAALGQRVPEHETTTDMGLHILAAGRVVKPIATENEISTFVLPQGAPEVRIVSRASTPIDTRPWLEDRRRLGVYVERIVLRNGSESREVPLDHPGLSQGWWGVERDGSSMRRWTDGGAVLPLPEYEGPTILEIHASSGGTIYLSDAELERAA